MTGVVFKPRIGKNIQAYVDDLIVKSSDRASHVNDLVETFANMRRASLKLNPEKCVLELGKEKFWDASSLPKGSRIIQMR
jgi:hypothetical protein